jgi:Tfp pilus assembly protein PilX
MKKIKSEAGFTIILFMALLLMLTLAGINAVMTSTTDVDIAGNEMNHSRAFYSAEAGLEKATLTV